MCYTPKPPFPSYPLVTGQLPSHPAIVVVDVGEFICKTNVPPTCRSKISRQVEHLLEATEDSEQEHRLICARSKHLFCA